MCTISLVPHPDHADGFILTSNRDESLSRNAVPPRTEYHKDKKLFFPMDIQSGGTWVGVSDAKRCICLMNGAEKPHERKAEYRKSRGIVVKDFLAADRIKRYAESYKFEGIEPFTMIVVEWNNGLAFYELIWNEVKLKVKNLKLREHIWSSSPLYSSEMHAKRKKWFEALKKEDGYTCSSLRTFHETAGEGDKLTNLITDRGFLKTQSITQIKNSAEGIKFWYKDLLKKEVTLEMLQFKA
ncbi:NRDE family protein [Gramella sp. AN32]|uniref:NRDE family protein n=1 Tax=Christiangramia antarctica TaxID=2058158 RepID=A0ABW5X5K8_9FLAO|nr:NRDE family protein [Gramella sp. AN32]MCM4154806.1 hypothetical protein [Gramella sp. AN32]